MSKNVTIQVIGGQPKTIIDNAPSTVEEAFKLLNLTGNYSASINGDAANMNDSVDDYSFITFAPSVKGGLI